MDFFKDEIARKELSKLESRIELLDDKLFKLKNIQSYTSVTEKVLEKDTPPVLYHDYIILSAEDIISRFDELYKFLGVERQANPKDFHLIMS